MDKIVREKDKEESGVKETVSLQIPSQPEYVLLARLVVSSVGKFAGLGPEDVYDLKLAVTEAATNVILHAAVESLRIDYRSFSRSVEVTVTDTGGGFNVKELTKGPGGDGGFGLAVIRNLVDEVVLDSAESGT
ncbi:MAG: ATP-binding protein, partial [Rubrobacter sp.]|nr:ATP-binding protein [Rubrobacter sp.]